MNQREGIWILLSYLTGNIKQKISCFIMRRHIICRNLLSYCITRKCLFMPFINCNFRRGNNKRRARTQWPVYIQRNCNYADETKDEFLEDQHLFDSQILNSIHPRTLIQLDCKIPLKN